MKKLQRIIFRLGMVLVVVSLSVVIAVLAFLWVCADLGAGYAAKSIASGVFLSHRPAESIRNEELGFLPWLFYEVDEGHHTVEAWLFPQYKRTAVYREGLGVALAYPESGTVALQAQARPELIPDLGHLAAEPWPMGDAPSGQPRPGGIDEAKLALAMNRCFAETNPLRKMRTRAVIVCYRGEIVAEQYGEGFNADTRLPSWSTCKSVAHALYGIAVRDGKIRLDDRNLAPYWTDTADTRSEITVDMLLRMSSGLAFNEYDVSPKANLIRMIYLEPNAGAFAASLPIEDPADAVFAYASGTTNILSNILRHTYGDTAYYELPYRELFSKIGMRSALLEADASGSFVASSFLFATARDFARFGLLYQNNGVWQGERILPEGWVEYAHTPTPTNPNRGYGAHWWRPTVEASAWALERGVPLPEDTFYASGFEGQKIVVIPSRELVIVRLGLVYFAGGYPFFDRVCDFLEAFPAD